MVEAISKEVPNKVTTKGGKKPQGKAFADFINDLGKTSAPKKTTTLNNPKSAESTPLQAPINNAQKPNITQDLTKQDFIKKVDLKSDSAPKSEILSNLLKGKNEENLKDKTTQSPLDMILSRPQATQTKLNQTPQIKNSAEQATQNFTNTPPPRAREEAKLPQQNPQDLKSLTQDLPKNKMEIPLDSAPKSAQKSNTAQENPQKSPLDSAPKTTISNEIKNQKNITLNNSKEPKNDIKDSLLSTNAQNDKGMLDSAPKAPKIESVRDFNPALENVQKDFAPKIAENPQKSPLDSAKKPPLDSNPTQENVQKDSALKIESALDSAKSQDSTPNEAQNLPQNIKIPTENKSNLGIANTLKYGAFKAFDALSLLKPSDGKKLSDLIKKADELALNLQSIKYTKMGENKGVAGLDSTKQNLGENKAQNIAQKPENEAKVQANQMLDSAPKQDFTQDSAKNENTPKKIDEKGAESKNIEVKNEPKKEAPQTNNETKNNDLKIAESKSVEPKNEPKQAESKSAESPLKNALEIENNDIKPINLKAEKIAESKKETPLDSIKDSAKDIKDAPKPTQENAPLTDAQGTSRITNKIFDARETMRHFAYALRQEIQNYKPPLSKITIELQPANLGSVEVSIISQGKNIQIQLHSNQNTLNLFIQNQSDLRTALSQIGYENVAMSFNNGAQMGFSDNSGKWRYESAQKSRNTFSLNDKSDEVDEIFEIMITNNYA